MSRNYFKYAFHLFVSIWISVAAAGSFDDFFEAIAHDDDTVVTRLLERGFDPNTTDAKGRTPLALALQADSAKVAEALWRHPKLKIDQANASGETALMLAAIRAQDGWARRLVERGAAVNRDGWAPLHYAAAGTSASLVGWLLERGAVIDARAPNGTTALMMAAGYGSEDSVELLRQRGAATTLKSDQGLDAAAFARKAGREALAQRLLDGGR